MKNKTFDISAPVKGIVRASRWYQGKDGTPAVLDMVYSTFDGKLDVEYYGPKKGAGWVDFNRLRRQADAAEYKGLFPF